MIVPSVKTGATEIDVKAIAVVTSSVMTSAEGLSDWAVVFENGLSVTSQIIHLICIGKRPTRRHEATQTKEKRETNRYLIDANR